MKKVRGTAKTKVGTGKKVSPKLYFLCSGDNFVYLLMLVQMPSVIKFVMDNLLVFFLLEDKIFPGCDFH